jgi:hypothetical protein
MEVICSGCGRSFIRSPRHPDQSYCSRAECQRKRKARWQKQKMTTDEHYRLNQRTSQDNWIRKNPGYWKRYRQSKPEQVQRNRLMQMIRNRRWRSPQLIAKMDASEMRKIRPYGQFYLVPMIAKMDALKVNIYGISASYP